MIIFDPFCHLIIIHIAKNQNIDCDIDNNCQMQTNNQLLILRQSIKAANSKAVSALVNLQINKVVQKKYKDLSMKFCLTQNLKKKNISNSESNQVKKQNPFLNPDPALLITELGDSHNLMFNKFNIFKDHLLVVTKEFQSQQNPLTSEDLKHAAMVMSALNGLIFFNGGRLSGASQPHKHLQLLPQQARQLPIFAQIHKFVHAKRLEDKEISKQKKIVRFPHFNFNHGIIVLQKNQNNQGLGNRLYQAYIKLYQFLQITYEGSKQKKDYNLIACEDFIVIFVRKQQNAFGKLSVNSIGFLGSVLFKDKETFEQYVSNENITPLSILMDISQTQSERKKEVKN